jgi:hypothetical protein
MNLEEIKAGLPLKKSHDEKWYVAAEVDRIIEAMAAQLQASQQREAALREALNRACDTLDRVEPFTEEYRCRDCGHIGMPFDRHTKSCQWRPRIEQLRAALSQAPAEGSSEGLD